MISGGAAHRWTSAGTASLGLKGGLNAADFGLIIGGGVEIGRFPLDARYNLGLTSTVKEYEAYFGRVPGDVKNRGFTVMAGFRLF